MGNRRKLIPPPSVLTPRMPRSTHVEMQVEPISFEMTPEEETFHGHLWAASRAALESAMTDLRLQGASEEQLAAFLIATRMVCIAEAWTVDLETVLLDLMSPGSRGPNFRQSVALALMPELAGIL